MVKTSWRSFFVGLADVLMVAAIYYGTGRLGLLLAIPPGVSTSVCPHRVSPWLLCFYGATTPGRVSGWGRSFSTAIFSQQAAYPLLGSLG
jgi:hypothetical protein